MRFRRGFSEIPGERVSGTISVRLNFRLAPHLRRDDKADVLIDADIVPVDENSIYSLLC
jgi:hypothetical protein